MNIKLSSAAEKDQRIVKATLNLLRRGHAPMPFAILYKKYLQEQNMKILEQQAEALHAETEVEYTYTKER